MKALLEHIANFIGEYKKGINHKQDIGFWRRII